MWWFSTFWTVVFLGLMGLAIFLDAIGNWLYLRWLNREIESSRARTHEFIDRMRRHIDDQDGGMIQ